MWEYLVEDLVELDPISFKIRLNELGTKGWEFCIELGNGRRCVFKRQIDTLNVDQT